MEKGGNNSGYLQRDTQDVAGRDEPAKDRSNAAYFPECSQEYWNGDSVRWERKTYSRKPWVLTENVVTFVQQCLNVDSRCKSKKQHHTAKRTYDRLVEECEFTGGETTVRLLVK